MNVPQGLAVDTAGNIFLADTGHNQIVILNSAGTTASTISTFDGIDTFSSPQDVATTPSGFYVTDGFNNRVVQFDSSGNFVRSFGDSVLSSPIGITTDSAGNVYVVSNNDGVIDKFSSGGSFINSFTTTTGDNTFIPNDIAIDHSSGNIYVTDLGNNRVVEFNSAESYVTSFGTLGVGLGQFTSPGGITIDPAGKILVTDLSNGRVEKFDSSGNLITVFGSFTADSNFSPGQFNLPSDVTTDSLGNVYVTDTNFNNISEYHFSPGGSPPAAPINLAATSISINTISLSWNASPGATSYTIYRSQNAAGPFSTVAGTTSSTSFPDIGLALGTTYYYEVSATSPSGQSGFSNTASAATLSLTHVPPTPINLATSAASATSISLSWNASPGATSYTIYRSMSMSGPFTTSVGTSTIPSFINTGLQPATTYYYEVSASNTDGTSGLSNTAAGTTSKTTTTTTLTSSQNPSIVGQSVTFTATVSPSTATGTVQFAVDGNNLGSPVSLSGGTAISIPSTLAVGPHTITAKYSGDANNAASTSNNVSQTVNQIPTTTTLTSSTNPSIVGQSVTFTATVSPNTAGGTVTFTIDGIPQLPVSLSNGKATFSLISLLVGPHTITAKYSGDANNAASTSNNVSQTTNQATTSSVTSSQNPSIVGQSVTFTATVSPSTATGTVQFAVDGNNLGSPVSLSGGTAISIPSTLAVGPHTVSATYSGDTNIIGSTATLTQTVNQSPTTTTLTSSTNPSIVGQSVTFTATVSPSTATGTVQFAVDGNNLGSPVSLSGGTAISIPSTLAVGPHTITAKYSGDTNNAASTSNNVSQTVNQIPTTTTLTSSTNPSIVGQSVTFTATISPTPTTGDMVTFYDGTTSIGTGTTNSAGKATLATSTLSITSHPITAAFGGDSSFTTSTSSPLAQTVNPLSLPTGLNATATSPSTISLSWNASPGATSYTIYRSTNPSGPFTTSIGTSTTTSFTDTGLSPTTTYYYEIAASNTASTSGLSNTALATTLAIIINSSTCPPAPTVTNIANINSYVIFGTHGVHIESSDVVNCGNVGEEPINDEIHIEENSHLSKSAIVGTNVHIEKNTSVYQAFYSRNLHNEGTAAAAPVKIHTTMISLPPFFPGTNTKGAKDVTISNSQTLPAGSAAYGKIKVNNGATLEFTGGNYTIDSLTIGDHATLKFDRATTLHINDQLNTGQSVTINPASSHVDAATVLFYVNHQIHLGKSSIVNANMYAQQEIHLEEHTVATGAFIGSSVHVEENSAITYDYGFPQSVPHQDNNQIISTHGQGSVGANTNFNFNVKLGNDKNSSLQGKLQFSDTTKKISLQSVSILTLSLAGNDIATFTGSGTVNNVSGYTFSVTAQDRADNTAYPDVFQITIFDKTGAQIYSNPGPVTQGDVEVETSDNGHSEKDH